MTTTIGANEKVPHSGILKLLLGLSAHRTSALGLLGTATAEGMLAFLLLVDGEGGEGREGMEGGELEVKGRKGEGGEESGGEEE